MNRIAGPLLAGSAFIVGFWVYGWQGLVLAATMTVFWLLIQFNRTLRLMRRAAERPLGLVDSAVMLQARLQHGLNLQEVIALTGSLGQKVGEPDDWRWHDNAGNEVVVCLRRGRVVRWYLGRPAEPEPAPGSADDAADMPVAPAAARAHDPPPDVAPLRVDGLGYPLDDALDDAAVADRPAVMPTDGRSSPRA